MKNFNGNMVMEANNRPSHLVVDNHNFNEQNRASLSFVINGNHHKNGLHHSSLTLSPREINGNLPTRSWQQQVDDKFEIPLPFGYHMDLDFLRFCSDELVSGETLDRLKELRKQRRKQRKTLEALMGIRQEQRKNQERKFRDIKSFNFNTRSNLNGPITRRFSSAPGRPLPRESETPEFIKDALKDAMKDFEQCLEKTKEGKIPSSMISSTPNSASYTKCARFNTFPRSLSSPDEDQKQQHATSTFKLFRENSNSSISSISTSSSAFPYQSQISPDAVLAGLPSSVPPKQSSEILEETDSIASITSEMSTSTLKNIREQMAKSLQKLREYEKQVEAIPVMQVKLSVLKEEKRLLMLKLKQRELQLRRERGELEESDGAMLDYDTEDEEFDHSSERVMPSMTSRFHQLSSRARSESPYARGGVINPDEFISVKKVRASGYNSDSDLIVPMTERKRAFEPMKPQLSKSNRYQNLSTPHIGRGELSFYSSGGQLSNRQKSPEKPKPSVREKGINTDPIPEPVIEVKPREKTPPSVRKRDRACNTDPPPRSPPPPRKVSHGTNTVKTRTMVRGTGTMLQMNAIVTKDEMDSKVQEAIFKTEEEIMGCPLLQKAMAKVEEEAMHGPKKVSRENSTSKDDFACQVGDDNLRPFVISVGLQCKLDESHPLVYESHSNLKSQDSGSGESLERKARVMDNSIEKIVRSIGVGDCKIIEDPKEPAKFRDIGICTEKWVEIIKASKQTDTEDFAYKDTESPRVADLFFEPSPERIVLERRSSLRRQSAGSPSLSRKSSVNSPIPSRKSSTLSNKPITRSQGTMTYTEMKEKVPTKDAKIGAAIPTKSVGTSVMSLNLSSSLPAPGSPLLTPDREKPKVNVCDKCDQDIQKVAQGIMAPAASVTSPKIHPPPLDQPWLSKIPRPVPENPDVHKLKSANSIENLSSGYGRPRSPMVQRSKSNLTPTQGRKLISSLSPIPGGRNKDVGTPPPHPSTPPVGSRRIPSPLARSHSPYSQSPEKRSMIPKLSPGPVRKQQQPRSSSSSNIPTSPLASSPSQESKSLIPRVVTPPALRKMYPKNDELSTPDRNVVRKNTFTKLAVGVVNPDLDTSSSSDTSKKGSAIDQLRKKLGENTTDSKKRASETDSSSDEKSDDKPKGLSSKGFPLPGVALFAPIDEHRTKAEPSKEMKAALKVLNDSIGRSTRGNAQVTNAINIIQQEWFKISSTKQSNPLDVEDYLDAIEDLSKELLDRVVNLTDVNGNTALHYSVSHGNFDVVSVLLDSKVGNPNIMNKAGYTCIMLISLAQIQNSTHRAVVARLFSLGDVNIRATQHGQTALMLAVSHGRMDMVQLLVEASADINIRDEDGSTALMCAAEHGHMEIVKYLLQQPETNVLAKDNDGLTALAVAMEAGHRDVGVILYANMSFSRGASPYSSMRMKKGASGLSSRTSTPTGKTPPPVTPTPPLRTRRNSSNQ